VKGGGLKADTGMGFLIKDARFVSLINRFFCGPVYPVLLSLSVIIGHITGLELYTAAINVLAVSVAFICICVGLRWFLLHLLGLLLS
jgi:hypothetical protein